MSIGVALEDIERALDGVVASVLLRRHVENSTERPDAENTANYKALLDVRLRAILVVVGRVEKVRLGWKIKENSLVDRPTNSQTLSSSTPPPPDALNVTACAR